jgi:hypothetical protein
MSMSVVGMTTADLVRLGCPKSTARRVAALADVAFRTPAMEGWRLVMVDDYGPRLLLNDQPVWSALGSGWRRLETVLSTIVRLSVVTWSIGGRS